jgi:hypothetical protein
MKNSVEKVDGGYMVNVYVNYDAINDIKAFDSKKGSVAEVLGTVILSNIDEFNKFGRVREFNFVTTPIVKDDGKVALKIEQVYDDGTVVLLGE